MERLIVLLLIDTITQGHAAFRLDDNSLYVTAADPELIAIEVGEQICWLGAACGAADSTDTLAIVTAEVYRSTEQFDGSGTPIESIYITFPRTEVLKRHLTPRNPEDCWKALFRNPAIAEGFPAPIRLNDEKGSEIPLNMMAGLADAPKVTVFDGQLMIKGFSSIFVPTL